MKYRDALKRIRLVRGAKNILVTGPQRSGTTITARILAYDLGLDYVDEDDVGWIGASENDSEELYRILENEEGKVIQAPACAHISHKLPDTTVVVFCIRDPKDIIASQERIGWELECVELKKYPEDYRAQPIAKTKYAYWEDVQRSQTKHWFEIEYESLRGHFLWRGWRDDFGARQWK